MKKFKKHIYMGDIHGSSLFVPFINKYDDGETKFFSVGDIFDRNRHSCQNVEKMKELHKEGKFDMVLGNHDLFFLLGWGLTDEKNNNAITKKMNEVISNDPKYNKNDYHKLAAVFYNQLMFNGGDATISSFIDGYGHNFDIKMTETVDFLWNNFSIGKADDLGNYIVHGGIPIVHSGNLVGDYKLVDGTYKYINGIDFIDEMSNKLKELDFETIKDLTATNKDYPDKVLRKMRLEGINISEIDNRSLLMDYARYSLPTWFDSNEYDKNKNILKSLREELNYKGYGRLVCGHFWNNNLDYGKLDNDILSTVVRIDRNNVRNGNDYNNFGFAIFDDLNNILKIGDIKDEVKNVEIPRFKMI